MVRTGQRPGALRVEARGGLTVFAGLVLSICGCTPLGDYVHNGFKVGPNYHRPPAAVSDQWIDAADPRVSPDPAPLVNWWQALNDPALTALVEGSYRQNLPLKEAAYRVLAARAQYGFAIGNFFPQQQQMTSDYTRRSVSESVANHQATPSKFFDVWDGGFNLSWEIDFWGRYRRSILSAKAQLNASVEDYDAVLVTLIGDVATAYIQLRTAEAAILVLQENVVLCRKIVEICKDRFKGGATSELDVQQAEALLGLIASFIPEQEILRREASNRLCVLIGIPAADLAGRIGPGGIPPVNPYVALGIPANLLRQRPDVRRNERLVAAQSEQIGIATSNLYPHLYINGTIGVASSPIAQLFEPRSLTGGVGPSMQWNIFNYGRLVNQIHVQEAHFGELVAAYQNSVLVANEEVENGIVSFLQSQEQAKARAYAVKAARKAVEISLEMYQDGRTDLNRVFVVERELALQQRQYTRSLGDIDLGLVQIYRALGGGWQIRLRDNDPHLKDPRPGPVVVPASQIPQDPLLRVPPVPNVPGPGTPPPPAPPAPPEPPAIPSPFAPGAAPNEKVQANRAGPHARPMAVESAPPGGEPHQPTTPALARDFRP